MRRQWYRLVGLAHDNGHLTHAQLAVARKLLSFLGPDGVCNPSYATVAAACCASPTTFGDTIARLRDLGLLSWDSRTELRGWREHQISNQYQFLFPNTAMIDALATPLGRVKRESKNNNYLSSSYSVPEPLAAVEAAALAEFRAILQRKPLANPPWRSPAG